MQENYSFSNAVAVKIASINYFGYLLGAIVSRYIINNNLQYLTYKISLIVCILSTAAIASSHTISLWHFWRFITGLTSGLLNVLGVSFVLMGLARAGRSEISGRIFCGVGIGIALTGIAVPILNIILNVDQIWLGLVILSLPPFLF